MRLNFTIFLILLFILLAGCASTVKNIHGEETESVDDTPYIEDIEEDPTFTEEQDDEAEIEVESGNIDSLLNLARSACEASEFLNADSLLKRASSALNKRNETAESEWLPLQDYVAEIISIYAELMPPEFSAPEEISTLIFKLHILESLLDTLKISPEDSVFLFRLSNKRGFSYDVPVVWNERVRRSTLFFMRTRKGVFDRWLSRAGYYLPVMEQMFADSGLPKNLACLPIIESGFNPHAHSRAHAAGIWQFIPSTGKAYGMRQNYWLDERRDPLKSTAAAIKYLRKLYKDFGDWHLALGAYNCGENGMMRTMKRDGASSYWELKTLPKETHNYVPLYLGSLIIAKNPDVFDFTFPNDAIFDPDIVTVNDCIELSTIARGIDIPLDTLKKMNPHILHWCTPPDMKSVNLYLPKGKAQEYEAFYNELPDDKKTKFYRYKIQSGDNMLTIARNFRVPVDALREINKMKTNHITAGRFLIIPIPVNDSVPAALSAIFNNEKPMRSIPQNSRQITYLVKPGDNTYRIAKLFGVTVHDILSWNSMSSSQPLKAGQKLTIHQPQRGQTANRQTTVHREPDSRYSGKHLVKQGESLYSISRELGISVNELASINGLDTRKPLIFPGDVLV
ncbi:MAG: LysM peptidoglycan-binding domain-containing protein, partial [Chitinispirillales bacterium]|nr:LysM peptidoglycan-binding domain-containing protein [Chitinispirillales bacterium]